MRTLVICPVSTDSCVLARWFADLRDFEVVYATRLPETLHQLRLSVAPTLIVRTDGASLQILKWVKGGPTCPVCLELRAMALRRPDETRAYLQGDIISSSSKQWLTPFAQEVVLRLASTLVRRPGDLDSFGYDIHLPTLEVRRFTIEPHSSCPLCDRSNSSGDVSALSSLVSRQKLAPDLYRVGKADQSSASTERYVNPTCGMFGALVQASRYSDVNAQVFGHFQEPGTRLLHVAWSGHQFSYRESLKVGLFEAFERHAGLKMRSKQQVVTDRYSNVKDRSLNPSECGLYEPEYLEKRLELTEFSDDLVMRWVWGYSLTEQRPLLVPHQLAFYADTVAGEPRFVHDNSNGCATGTCIEEAVFHGLLEVIERDAFIIHWYSRLSPPQIELTSIRDKNLRLLIDRLKRLELDVYLLDTRLDVAVPSICAVLLRRDQELGALALAAGCSFAPEQAIMSALGEIASFQVGFGGRTQYSEKKLRSALTDLNVIQDMEDHAAFYGLPEAVAHARFLIENDSKCGIDDVYRDWRANVPKTSDLLDDIRYCIELLATAGLNQVIVVDQTSPEELRAGLRTVRVIVPGMMPLDFGYGRCRLVSLPRLYSVPVRLGLRCDQMPPDRLNRVPHPFP